MREDIRTTVYGYVVSHRRVGDVHQHSEVGEMLALADGVRRVRVVHVTAKLRPPARHRLLRVLPERARRVVHVTFLCVFMQTNTKL